VTATGWRIATGSTPGPRHAAAALSRRDAWRRRMLAGGLLALAVADGAETAARAALGATFAAEAAITAATACFPSPPADLAGWRDATERFAAACLAGFDDEVARAGGARADYATTLLAVVLGPPYLAFLSVGDANLVAQREPGGPALVLPSRPGCHAVPLTAPDRRAAMRSGVLADTALTAVALGADALLVAART